MTTKEVLEKYQKKVAFPITPEKIRAAGYDVTAYLKQLVKEVKNCSDYDGRPLGF